MKLPEKIKGRNRIRDGAIVLFFKRDHLDFPELANIFKLSERHIVRILSRNHAFIKRDKEWEKEKRIARLNRWLKNKPVTLKDPVEIQSELRKEIEGDGESSKSSTNKIVIVYPTLNNKQETRRIEVGDIIENRT